MNRGLIIVILVLSALVAAVAWLTISRAPAKPSLHIRIAGLAAKISPRELEWLVAVPRPGSRRPAGLFWSVGMQETNKTRVQTLPLLPSPTEQDLLSIGLSPDEDGILTWGPGESLKPETAYRVIGAYCHPGPIEAKLASWSLRVPRLERIIARLGAKPVMATSEWFSVTSRMKPSSVAHE